MRSRITSPAFQLYAPYATLLEQAARVHYGLLHGCFIGKERQVTYDEGFFRGTGNRLAMVNHFIHCQTDGVFESEYDHGQRIAYKNHLGTALFYKTGGRIIIGGDH